MGSDACCLQQLGNWTRRGIQSRLPTQEFVAELAKQSKEDDPHSSLINQRHQAHQQRDGDKPGSGPASGASSHGQKDLKGNYMGMAELLKDNMEVDRKALVLGWLPGERYLIS